MIPTRIARLLARRPGRLEFSRAMRARQWAVRLSGLLVLLLSGATPAAIGASSRQTVPALGRNDPASRQPVTYEKSVLPLLRQFCYGCHGDGKKKGGVALDAYPTPQSILVDRATWEHVLKNLRGHLMPPEGKPQPADAERELIASWVESQVYACDCKHPDPGRVTLRRLNRTEYNNTIRDLVGVDFQPAEDFPADDSGYGFDNIGDVLSMSPVLLEKYLAAAEKILNAAIVTNALSGATNLPAPHRRIFFHPPAPETRLDCARDVLRRFASRAWRRPATTNEINRLLGLAQAAWKQGEDFEQGLKVPLAAVLVSPHFLFRGEFQAEPDNPKAIHPIDDYALASRLSYFLWSTMPDEELFALARRKALRKNLDAQVRRMLKDPKSRALVENFAGQWLQLRNLRLAAPDAKTFPAFDEKLRDAMEAETEMFFAAILNEDRSVLEFLNADWTFLNERLARHYGIPGVQGEQLQRVSLKPNARRGGVLTHASVLTLTSNPTRTSPVKRGKFVLENILGTPPPPPPPNVPELKEGTEAGRNASLRRRMEEHRANPMCASCHARMDPIGFGFENYDGIGAWREKDGDFPVETAGQLVSGEAFNGPAELRGILVKEKRDLFARCLAEKMLTYALGRGLEYYDKCALDEITKGLARRNHRFSALVLEIARSTPFQMRRGDAAMAAAPAP
jgi:hypothetical protein